MNVVDDDADNVVVGWVDADVEVKNYIHYSFGTNIVMAAQMMTLHWYHMQFAGENEIDVFVVITVGVDAAEIVVAVAVDAVVVVEFVVVVGGDDDLFLQRLLRDCKTLEKLKDTMLE